MHLDDACLSLDKEHAFKAKLSVTPAWGLWFAPCF